MSQNQIGTVSHPKTMVKEQMIQLQDEGQRTNEMIQLQDTGSVFFRITLLYLLPLNLKVVVVENGKPWNAS